jgi:hypothetical protein
MKPPPKSENGFERLDSGLNMNFPQRGREDYREANRVSENQYRKDHKEEIKIKNRKYHNDHKEERNLRRKQQYENDKEKKKTLIPDPLHKENMEEILIRARIRGKEIYLCKCGKQCSNNYKSLHNKTVFHKQYMERAILATDLFTPISRIQLPPEFDYRDYYDCRDNSIITTDECQKVEHKVATVSPYRI